MIEEGTSKNERTSPAKLIRSCSKPGCDNKADRLQCPQCKAKGDERCLEYSFFCSQACFKEYYGIHKLLHDTPDAKNSGKE